ncbi:MAG TPA: S41 family peptidase [Pyrinomonadaceae bacterium]|nr:S41 family peptidase [Pyrinomonadaceae bacterium]
MKREMADHYANLEWAIEHRGLDLKQLSERTETRLRQARTDAEAQAVIESFLGEFGDGHLYIEWARKGGDTTTGHADSRPAKQPALCERLGYRSQDATPRLVFSRLNNFREVKTEDSRYFPTGVLSLPGGRNVGVIRIHLFSEYMFPDLCEKAVSEAGLTGESPCDEECDERIERAAANLLTAAFARQITSLKRSKIHALMVDITGNGGGTNWAEAAARTLTAKPLRSPRQAFIRHEHWTRQLKTRLTAVEADARQASPPHRDVLLRAAETLRQAMLETQHSCARESIWENRKPGCSLIASMPPLYPQSVLPYAKPGSLPEMPSSRYIFYPSRYAYDEGVYAGRLLVLVDRGTASSAEYFTALLRDNHATTVIGEPTVGAGCGYTNRGIPTVLKNSGAKVKIPDCVRLRADGSNEVEGITPDVLVPWRRNDSPYQKVKRVFDILPQTLGAENTR